jgi:DNA uptake protein ComE-like DNA-binding protein
MKTHQITEAITIELDNTGVGFVRYPATSRRATDVELILIQQQFPDPVELTAEPQTRININAADLEVLKLLPSIGDKSAAYIVENRPFLDVDNLVDRLSDAGMKPSKREIEGLVNF